MGNYISIRVLGIIQEQGLDKQVGKWEAYAPFTSILNTKILGFFIVS